MAKNEILFELLGDIIEDISFRVAGLRLHKLQDTGNAFFYSVSLFVTAKEDDNMIIVLQTDKYVLRKISEEMKRQSIIDENESFVYAIEFFNILCGHIIASYNKIYHKRTRFSIPELREHREGEEEAYKEGLGYKLDYECDYGLMRIQLILNECCCG